MSPCALRSRPSDPPGVALERALRLLLDRETEIQGKAYTPQHPHGVIAKDAGGVDRHEPPLA